MRILFINSVIATSWGGGEKWMLTAASGLRSRGHDVYFAGRCNSIFLDRAAEKDFETLPLKVSGDFNPSTIAAVRKFLRSKNIDSIIPNFNKDVRLAGIAARLISPRPMVLHRNGLPIVRNKQRYRFSYKGLVDGIVTNTHAIRNRYMQYGWIEEAFVRVIHNGIDVDIPVEFDTAGFRAQFSLPAEGPLIGLVGRLVQQKQPLMFLEVARKILDEIDNVSFVIVGEGPLRPDIIRHAGNLGISDHIFLLGAQKDVFPIYAMLDVLLLPSEDEGLPNVVLEAMLCSTPAIAFEVGGVRELIPSEKTGIVVPPDDVYLMAKKSLQLLRDSRLRKATGQAARQYIRENFSVDGMIDKLECYLNDLRRQ